MEHLRPLERRVLAMRDDGLDAHEIGRRIGRSPDRVERIISWTEIPRSKPPSGRFPRAIEQRVLALLHAGESHEQVAERFKRTPRSIRQIAGFAHYRLGIEMLRASAAEARAGA